MHFLFYFTIGRPVNRRLFESYYKVLIQYKEFVLHFQKWASEILLAYLKTSSHRLSFHKYNERILNEGLQLPSELRSELEYYLDKQNLSI